MEVTLQSISQAGKANLLPKVSLEEETADETRAKARPCLGGVVPAREDTGVTSRCTGQFGKD